MQFQIVLYGYYTIPLLCTILTICTIPETTNYLNGFSFCVVKNNCRLVVDDA